MEAPECSDSSDRVASIDIGVDNSITMINNIGEKPIAIKDRVIKFVNHTTINRKH